MSKSDTSAKLFKGAVVVDSTLKCLVTIGDHSKVQSSIIGESVRIDRNNYIDSSKVGCHSYTGRNTSIIHAKVGAFCSISWNVTIGGANHDYSRIAQHSFLYDFSHSLRPAIYESSYDRFSKPVIVGNDVWIAAGVVVTRGVTIGDGAVVGANAVVTHDIPPYAIVTGVPAKVIKYRFEEKIITVLLKLKWWDWPEEKIKKNFLILSKKPIFEQLKGLL